MNEYYTVKELAEKYRLSEKTVYYWISLRLFPIIKINNKLVRIPKEDFEQFMIEKRSSIYEQRRG